MNGIAANGKGAVDTRIVLVVIRKMDKEGLGMAWWKWWNRDARVLLEQTVSEKMLLYREICVAKREWENAHALFQEATEVDEIDYAIYLLEATEKRYDMLIKKAKRIQLSVLMLNA